MKKIIFIATAVAGLFAAAACQKDAVKDGPDGQTATVTLSVSTPSVQTKTISDGEKVNIVHWAAFDNAGKPISGLAGTAVINGKKAEFDVTLVKHYNYKFVFWAHVGDDYGQNAAYGLSSFNEEGKVVVNYGGNANDENRDAFYKNEEITITSDNQVKKIELTRPFAQINFLAADYQHVESVGLHADMTSKIVMTDIPTVLNGLDGTVSGNGSVSFVPAAVPEEKFTIGNTTYGWYSMNYILAGDKDQKDVTGIFYHAKNTAGVNIPVTNVPYERNHRTNIIGNFFTENVKVQVIVKESFDGRDYVETYPKN